MVWKNKRFNASLSPSLSLLALTLDMQERGKMKEIGEGRGRTDGRTDGYGF